MSRTEAHKQKAVKTEPYFLACALLLLLDLAYSLHGPGIFPTPFRTDQPLPSNLLTWGSTIRSNSKS